MCHIHQCIGVDFNMLSITVLQLGKADEKVGQGEGVHALHIVQTGLYNFTKHVTVAWAQCL